jgi:hypothetical protein
MGRVASDGAFLTTRAAALVFGEGDLFHKTLFALGRNLEKKVFRRGREEYKKDGNDLEDGQEENQGVLGHILVRGQV